MIGAFSLIEYPDSSEDQRMRILIQYNLDLVNVNIVNNLDLVNISLLTEFL